MKGETLHFVNNLLSGSQERNFPETRLQIFFFKISSKGEMDAGGKMLNGILSKKSFLIGCTVGFRGGLEVNIVASLPRVRFSLSFSQKLAVPKGLGELIGAISVLPRRR